jgi:hypothetical protein
LNRLWSEVLGQSRERECENERCHSDGEDSITEGIRSSEPRVAISIHIGPHMFLIRGLRKSITEMAHAVENNRPGCRSFKTSRASVPGERSVKHKNAKTRYAAQVAELGQAILSKLSWISRVNNSCTTTLRTYGFFRSELSA